MPFTPEIINKQISPEVYRWQVDYKVCLRLKLRDTRV